MIIYPAIDIRGGRAVRLVQGDFSAETAFDADPADAARRWTDAGASWIHIVDLDASRSGSRANANAIAAIRAATDVPLQLGGGIRTREDVRGAFNHGINRVILGSVAISDPEFVESCAAEFPVDALAVGLDARNGKLAANGWLDQSDVVAYDAAIRFANAGIRNFIYTDIHRDGTFQGPNLEHLQKLIDGVDGDIIASGGIGSLDDVRNVRDLGAAGCIIGSALYHQKFQLQDALALARETTRA